jgi:chaperonin GroES
MQAPSFRLLDNRIATEKEPIPDKIGSIHVTEGAIKSRQLGLVIKCGPGAFENGTQTILGVTPGDIILYSNYAGTDCEFDGRRYLILTGTSSIMFVVGRIELDEIDFEDRWEEVWKVAGGYQDKQLNTMPESNFPKILVNV